MGRLLKSPTSTIYMTSLIMQLLFYSETAVHGKYLETHGT